MEIIFLIGRILLGGYFVMNGLMHLMKTSMPAGYVESRGLKGARPLTILTGILLLLAGLGIILGVYVTLSIWGLVLFLVLVSFMVHHFWSDADPKTKMMEKMHFMTNLAIVGALLMLLMVSQPWIYSIF